MAHAPRPSATKPVRTTDSSATPGGEEAVVASSASSSLTPATQTPRQARPRDPPPFERAVVSRTRFHIALPTPPPPPGVSKAASTGSEADRRGWSSPHGEPYRPLGRPELNLKFSPQLVYGVSPIMQNAHRIRGPEGGAPLGGGTGGAVGTGNISVLEKGKELREPSSCASTSNAQGSLSALVDQFVTSLTSRKRPLDDRQVKLAHRLQANVGGFSPERVRALHQRKNMQQEEYAGGEQPHFDQIPRGDTSLQLLREAINEGTSRLRSTRNGTNFLQKLPPSDFQGLRDLHEQYLRARTKTPQPVLHGGSGDGARSSPRMILGSKATHIQTAMRHKTNFTRDGEDSSTEDDDGQGTWYLPYTSRRLQRSPHRRLPSLGEFRVRARDEKQPARASKASSVSNRMRVSTARSNHASLTSVRSAIATGALNTVGENCDDGLLEPIAAMPPAAANKSSSSPFTMTATSSSAAASVQPLHSIEKLQAAVDALEATKCQQSGRLATALGMLEQDRRECLAGKFRSLRVHCDAVEDLRRMRERSERRRGQQVLAVLTKTADWYPELLRRLLAREGVNGSTAGTTSVSVAALLPLHAAELFIVQAVRRFTNEGCEFQSTQLFQVILHLHHDDLELLQVQQLIMFLRSALHINHGEWTHFIAAHGLPEPIEDFAIDRKDFQDGKLCFTAARAPASVSSLEDQV